MIRFSIFVFFLFSVGITFAQNNIQSKVESQKILDLIKSYSQSRETKDTVLLKDILTDDMDQLVSSGEWRTGIDEAIKGMMESSTTNPGTRTLHVERIRFLADGVAIVDARYEIKNPDESIRKMWSSFTVVDGGTNWKISAIRNMLPTGN